MDKLRRDVLCEDEYRPQDAGWDAHLEGVRRSDNPYAINNWKYYDWDQGWVMAAEAKQPTGEDDRESSSEP